MIGDEYFKELYDPKDYGNGYTKSGIYLTDGIKYGIFMDLDKMTRRFSPNPPFTIHYDERDEYRIAIDFGTYPYVQREKGLNRI